MMIVSMSVPWSLSGVQVHTPLLVYGSLMLSMMLVLFCRLSANMVAYTPVASSMSSMVVSNSWLMYPGSPILLPIFPVIAVVLFLSSANVPVV